MVRELKLPVKTSRCWLPYLLILLPVALSVAFVHEFAVNVVFRDQWEMVSLFRNLYQGKLSFLDLWSPHNEHRFFFPRIAMLSLGTLTAWNNIAEMYLIQVCLLATLVSLLLAFKVQGRSNLLLFVPIAFLVFSLRQAQNMLWGYQLTFAFAQTFSVIALFLLYVSGHTRYKRIAFAASALSGAVAAFSAIQGLLVWPAGLLQLLIAPVEKKVKRFLVVSWCLIGVIVWIVYFVGYERDVSTPVPDFLATPITGAGFFLTMLGGPLFPQPGLVFISAAIMITLITVIAVVLHKEGRWGEFSFWVSLLAFSLLISLAIAAGRIAGGVEAATPSKYTTFSILAVISLYAMLVKLRSRPRFFFTPTLLGVPLAFILLSIPASYWNGMNLGAAIKADREEAAFVLANYPSQPDERLLILNKRPENVRRLAPILERLGYNVFSESQHKD